MAFTFETSGNNTFLVYAIQEEDVLDTMTLGMITNNRIPGIASVLYTQMNRECFLKYNVTAKVTVKQFFSGVVNRRRLLGVFSSVAAALASAEEYMIDGNSLLLDTDYIYADVSNCRAEVICLPMVREAGAVDSGLFFKNIMFSTQFDQTENCDYVARIINHLNSTPVFVVGDFLRLLEELQGTGGASSYGEQMYRARSVMVASQVNAMPQPQQSALTSQSGVMAQSQQPVPVIPAETAAQSKQSTSGGPAQPQAASIPRKQADLAASGQGSTDGFAMPGQGGVGGFAVPGQGSGGEFAVPGQSVPGGTVQADQQTAGKKQKAALQQPASEKGMSMFYLLQHYNKENAAIYKAQKEARKKSGNAALATNSASVSGFSVPGQQPVQPQIPQPVAQKSSGQAQMQQSPGQLSVQPVVQPQMPQPSVQPAASLAQSFPASDNFGDTVVMGANDYGEDTVVIGEAMAASAIRPYLRRSSNNEKIFLDKPIFRIGKERSYVDYCISGNATISRSHADIIDRNGQFFIVDNNSTNHTYVNGEMIPSNTEIPLSHGTRIRLSNEEFEFLTF